MDVLNQLSLNLLLLFVMSTGADENVTAVTVNSTVAIECPMTCLGNKTVVWDKIPSGLHILQQVNRGSQFLNGFNSPRFSFDSKRKPGECILLINNVKLNDSGIYNCRDTTDSPKKWSTNLIVAELLDCKEIHRPDMYIGENEFGLTQTTISIRCTLLYRGNRHLALQMTLYNKEYQWETHRQEPIFQDFSHLTYMYGELRPVSTTRSMSNSVFVCEAIINSSSDRYHYTTNICWQSDPLNIKFAKMKNRPVKPCPRVVSSLDCNPPCTYEQKEFSNGTYYCQSNYTLNGQTFTMEVVSYFHEFVSYYWSTIIIVIVALVFIAILVVIILVLLYEKRNTTTPLGIQSFSREGNPEISELQRPDRLLDPNDSNAMNTHEFDEGKPECLTCLRTAAMSAAPPA